jgi:hypothetical protein
MEDLIKEHKELFGVEPVIIGLVFYDVGELFDRIAHSIDMGKPYNEYELLSPEEREAFEKGDLLF